MKSFKLVLFTALVLGLATLTFAQKKSEPQGAPLPAEMLTAKKVFLLWSGGPDKIYDAFYDELKKFGRFELVSKPSDADLIFNVSFGDQGAAPTISRNYVTGQVYSVPKNSLHLMVISPKENAVIWTNTVFPEDAIRDSAWEKNKIKTASILIGNMRKKYERQ